MALKDLILWSVSFFQAHLSMKSGFENYQNINKKKGRGKAPDRQTKSRTTQNFKPRLKVLRQSNNNKIYSSTQKAGICWRQETDWMLVHGRRLSCTPAPTPCWIEFFFAQLGIQRSFQTISSRSVLGLLVTQKISPGRQIGLYSYCCFLC